jgi:hypothetical protein
MRDAVQYHQITQSQLQNVLDEQMKWPFA